MKSLIDAVKPFYLLAKDTAGRIEHERLSGKDWHDLWQAYIENLRAPQKCDDCGANLAIYVHGCPTCAAPQCCQQCCKIAHLKGELEHLTRTRDYALIHGLISQTSWLIAEDGAESMT